MKRYLALLLSMVMVVTFMPTMALTAYAESSSDKYEVKLSVNGATDVNVFPGDEFTLKATLYKNDVPVTDDQELGGLVDRFELSSSLNAVYDYDEDDIGIVSLAEGVDWACGDGNFGCIAEVIPFFEFDGGYDVHGGHASFSVKAVMKDGAELYSEESVEIEVGCHPSYENKNILAGDGYRELTVAPNTLGEKVIIDPSYKARDDIHFDFEVGHRNEDGDLDAIEGYADTRLVDDALQLSRSDIMELIKNTDPDFVVRVIASGEDEDSKHVIYGAEDITVLVDIPNIFADCYIDSPSSISYDPNCDDIYDVLDKFKLYAKSDKNKENEIDESRQDLYEWRFVDADPDSLPTKEVADAASVLVDKTGERPDIYDEASYFNDYDIPTSKDNYRLKLDHLGKYWVVVAGGLQYGREDGYKGFIIKGFELTDADVFYANRPQAIEPLEYTGKQLDLVTAGEVGIKKGYVGPTAVLQYSMDGQSWDTTVPTATDAGDYTVYYRVVELDNSDNIIIPADSVNVTIFKQKVTIKLKEIHKIYGEPDSLNYDNMVDESSIIPDGFDTSRIVFTRENGENVNRSGYNITARYDGEEGNNYEILFSDGRLFIDKADSYISVIDTISCVKDKPCTIEYRTNAENVDVDYDHDKLDVIAEDGMLEITANQVCDEEVKLIAYDDNHNHSTKTIRVVATAAAVADGAVYSKGDGLNGEYTLSVNSVDSKEPESFLEKVASIFIPEEESTEEAKVEITLKDGDNEQHEFDDGIVVRVKMTEDIPDLEKLRGGKNAAVSCDMPECNHNAWIEYIDGDAYFCFETTHLSEWTLSAEPAIDLGDESSDYKLVIPETVDIISDDEGYLNLNLGDVLLDGDNNPVDPACYKLVFSKNVGHEKEYYDAITEPGTYSVTAEAIEGMGYKGSIDAEEQLTVIAHDHNFEWIYNSENHWKECNASNCGVLEEIGKHNFDQEVQKAEYLISDTSCTDHARYYKSCECGARGTDTFVADDRLKRHTLEYVEDQLEEDGFCKHYKCTECGKCFSDMLGLHEVTIEQLQQPNTDKTDSIIIGTVVVVGATAATVAIVKTVDTLIKEAKAAKEAEEAAKILDEAKDKAKEALGEALGESTDPVVGAYFDEGFEAVTAAKTPDEVLEATAKYVNLVNEAKTVVETKIKLNKAAAQKNGKIKLTFKNPGLDGVVSYHVERSTKKDFSKNLKTYKVKTSDKGTIVYNNTKNLKKGTKYYYQVYAKIKLSDGNIVETNLSNVRSAKCKKSR